MKDKVYRCIGASNHTADDRAENDYYATDPNAIDALMEVETFQNDIWECCCGEGHLSKRLWRLGYHVISSDLIDRGYGSVQDFLKSEEEWSGDIITNPPYRIAQKMVEHSLDLIRPGAKAAFFLKLTFLEGQRRRKMFDIAPPKSIHVFSKRINCAKNGDFESIQASAIAYAWIVWEKGFEGKPSIDWI